MRPQLDVRDLAARQERRQGEVCSRIGREYERVGGGWMIFSGPGSWNNQACALGLDAPVAAGELDRLVEFYSSRGVEPQIEVCSYADDSLIAGLSARGFRLREFENVFAAPVADREPSQSSEISLQIRNVDPADDVDLSVYAEVSTSGFRPKGEPISEALLESSIGTLRQPDCRGYIVERDGEPVAAGGMGFSAGLATLFGTTVLPAHRRLGVQSALIEHRFIEARELGCDYVLIHSRPGSSTEGNARRLGFELMYFKVQMVMPREGLAPSP